MVQKSGRTIHYGLKSTFVRCSQKADKNWQIGIIR